MIALDLFLDTNVIIGKIFSLDPLHKASNRINLDKNTLYYSFHVKKEVQTVFYRKNQSYLKFLKNLYMHIEKYSDSSIINKEYLIRQIRKFDNKTSLKKKDMVYAFERIWTTLDFDENQEAYIIKKKLLSFINMFEAKNFSNKEKISKTIYYIPKYSQKDLNLFKIINQPNIKANLHEEDANILFDVHEFCERNPKIKMYFVSWDKKFIKAVGQLKNHTSIYDFISLEDVLSNKMN